MEPVTIKDIIKQRQRDIVDQGRQLDGVGTAEAAAQQAQLVIAYKELVFISQLLQPEIERVYTEQVRAIALDDKVRKQQQMIDHLHDEYQKEKDDKTEQVGVGEKKARDIVQEQQRTINNLREELRAFKKNNDAKLLIEHNKDLEEQLRLLKASYAKILVDRSHEDNGMPAPIVQPVMEQSVAKRRGRPPKNMVA